MNNINKIITTNFNANIAYLQSNHKELFEKLSALDSAVEHGHFIEKFELVYEEGDFDVFEKTTNNYLYNKQLSKHTKLSLDSVNYDLDNNMFESFFKRTYSDEMIQEFQKIKEEEEPLRSHLGYTTPITHFTQKETDKRTQLNTLDKFVFFGVGLGSHIKAIDEKISAKVYLIVEDSLELFRLSLFTTNYALLAKKATLFFSIFEDDTEFSDSCQNFLDNKYYFNHYIKYFQLLSHSEDKANKFYIALLNQPHLQFFFNDYLHIMIKPLEYFSQNYKTIQKSLSFNTSELKKVPFLLIASGPSLQNNIKWLKEHQESFMIIAVSSSMKYLAMHNITPHIVLHLDPFNASLKSFEILKTSKQFDETIFFMAASSPSNVMQELNKENTYIYETNTSHQDKALSISGACVGSITYQLLLVLQVEEIYLLGLDLAVDQKTGKDHAGAHQDLKQLTLKNDLEGEEVLSYKKNLFEIKGNFHEKVFTTPHFYSSVDVINRYFSKLQKSSQKVYNLSDGAFFKGTSPLKISQIKTKANILTTSRDLLKKILIQNSTIGFQSGDIEKLKIKLQHAKRLKKQLKKFDIKTVDNAQQYVQKIYTILIQEEALGFYELTRVLDAYIYYILHFVYDYLNSDDITLDNYKEIDILLKQEIFSILDYYIEKLQSSIGNF